jgi:hypothetical protein
VRSRWRQASTRSVAVAAPGTTTSGSGEPPAGAAATVVVEHEHPYFHGWNVVGATFVMALFSFGLGFYGLAVYVATLQRLFGWSASTVSAPVTAYYIAGALVTTAIGHVYERLAWKIHEG